MDVIKLIVLNPGHFHAALIQKTMYPWVSERVSIYAPLGPELLDYLNRVSLFNSRLESPTNWQLDIHTSSEAFERMLEERPGDVVVIAGRNRPKIDFILGALQAGLHVLADKPWIISSADLPKLASALTLAETNGLVAYDIMTERHEITSILQKELVNDPDVFGTLESVMAKSIHHLMKLVAGVPIRRPAWFFDIEEYGEALADVGTHVVDLVQWTAFPEQQIDHSSEVRMIVARRWPTVITQAEFQEVTGQKLDSSNLDYYCNNYVEYTIRGIPVQLEILWNWQAPAAQSGDIYEAAFRGTKARIEIRQGPEQNYRPELYVVPTAEASASEVFRAVEKRIEIVRSGTEAHVVIPEKYRIGHEAHFGQVANRFFDYLRGVDTLPAWENANMLTKYYISTKGVELSNA
jgi:predicted dehydrogenase